MYLESFTIKNYRKFGEKDNTIYFVNASEIGHSTGKTDTEINPLISSSSTLIIGKNNAGKTTITNALTFIAQEKNKSPKSTDFNVYYLKNLLKKYVEAYEANNSFEKLPTPELEFILRVKIDSNGCQDLITNLSSFITLSNHTLTEPIEIKVIYGIKDTQIFYEHIKKIILEKKEQDKENENKKDQTSTNRKTNTLLEKLCELLDDKTIVEYNVTYKNINDSDITSFSLHNLFSIRYIRANRHLNENVLTTVFQRIVSSQFEDESANNDINQGIDTINTTITGTVQSKNNSVSEILQSIENNNHVDLLLTGNVTKKSILKSLIKYSFTDGDEIIPEDQFGLGYVNLLNIIGEIIHYIDNYEANCHQSRINLLFIEEPEVFMHPQMQEFFISRIDNAVQKALQLANNKDTKFKKTLQCQIVVTTHSSHIVNSKIHSGNSFNNINYLTIKDKFSIAIPLNDKNILDQNSSTKNKDITFLKKHIKYKVSELFFSDAVIFVEGVTEETLLHYYLEQNDKLKNHYITLFRIEGNYSKVYLPLIRRLNIPCLIITDLDIKRYECEKNKKHKKKDKDTNNQEDNDTNNQENKSSCPICKNKDNYPIGYAQIIDLDNRETTNPTLINLLKSVNEPQKANSLSNLTSYKQEDYLCIVYQKDPIEGQFATSLEEAFILTNYQNKLVQDLIEQLRKKVYNEITDNGKDKEKIKDNSYRLQSSLSNKDGKSVFASELLYELITSSESDKPKLPQYIQDGLAWLEIELNKGV